MEENFHIPIKIDGTCDLFFCVVRSEWNYFNDRHSPTHMSIEHHIKQSLKISINIQYESNTHRTKKRYEGYGKNQECRMNGANVLSKLR